MTILIKQYRIRSYQYGFTLAKKKCKTWKIIGYFSSINQAIDSMFDHWVKTETNKFVIDFNNEAQLDSQKTALLQKIRNIKNEILEGLRDGQQD